VLSASAAAARYRDELRQCTVHRMRLVLTRAVSLAGFQRLRVVLGRHTASIVECSEWRYNCYPFALAWKQNRKQRRLMSRPLCPWPWFQTQVDQAAEDILAVEAKLCVASSCPCRPIASPTRSIRQLQKTESQDSPCSADVTVSCHSHQKLDLSHSMHR